MFPLVSIVSKYFDFSIFFWLLELDIVHGLRRSTSGPDLVVDMSLTLHCEYGTHNEFFDYFIEQWLVNEEIPVVRWICYHRRHRANNAVESWNNKQVL
jgi:hypothetical protein